MLRLASVRSMRGLRCLSTAGPTREPGVVGLPMADDTSINVRDIHLRALSSAFPVSRLPSVELAVLIYFVLLPSCDCARCVFTLLLCMPYQTLTELYNRTLTAVKGVPADAAYRVNIEKTAKHRLAILQESNDIADVEAKFGIGQIEEVIEIAQDELELIPHMAAWKPWEVAEGKPGVKIELID